MKGSEGKLIKYMEGSDKRFVIPVYQRNYDWKIENCKQLYDDLVKIINNQRKNHFFGSLVSVYNPKGQNEEFLIIDGQQRLTTVSLLLLAMYNLMNKKIIASDTRNLKDRIFEEFLVDKWQQEETRIKLKPIKNDQAAFGKLFEDSSDEYIRESNLTVNYNYFYDRIQQKEITMDQLYEAICRLEIINIRLDPDDNPQLIFESLNSTGLDLSEGDKIRNFILMGLPAKEQEKYYDKYWNKIEMCTKYDVSAFVRDYLSVKQQAIPPQKKIHSNFKEFFERTKMETESLLADMLAYAKRYQILLNGSSKSATLDSCIERLNCLETTITRPYFLEVLRLYDEKKLTLEQVTEIFLIIENYLFRRMMCELPTNGLNKTFLLLHKEIIRYDNTENDYVEKLKYALMAKKDRGRFPRDEEFKIAFTQRPIYSMNSKNRIYIFERFENFGTLEDKDVYRHFEDGTYSIEHIMPQQLTPEWHRELGKDYAKIHEMWVHRIANLTLTAYNAKYSNRSFMDKKTMTHGFESSGIRLNAWIAKKNHWTLKELEERNEHLMNQALIIWPVPSTDYVPQEKQFDTSTLEEMEDLTNRQISKFTFKNTEQPVKNWSEMFQKVLQILDDQDKSILPKLATSKEKGLSSHFALNPQFIRPFEIRDGFYVDGNTSTTSKLNILDQLFKLYNEDSSDLVFYLREEKDDQKIKSSEDKLSSSQERHLKNQKYWTYALAQLQKSHEPNGPFSKIGPSKDNWIIGYFGVGGFNLCCVANQNGARVEVLLNKSKQANKKAFDDLYSHKEEIESKLGTSLEWKRGDDIKSSKVFIELKNVNIDKESDWPKMAAFHANWSKNFLEVIVPYFKKEGISR